MKTVLISIRPEWVEKITSGKKTIEVRKSVPKETPFKAYIYCSYGDMKTNYYLNGRGKVIGEFICDKVIKTCGWRLRGYTQQCAKRTPEEEILPRSACLSIDEIVNYAGGENGEICGWHISDLRIYDEPKELSEFYVYKKVKGGCENCAYYRTPTLEFCQDCKSGKQPKKYLTSPPQPWMYVEEIETR